MDWCTSGCRATPRGGPAIRPPSSCPRGCGGWGFRWGLVPPWAKDPSIGVKLINARSETLLEKRSFARPFRTQRLLVPMDGFYEWRTEGGHKQPYHIRRIDRRPFAVAGLFEKWHPEHGETLVSCTLLTGVANPLVAQLHDRMPVILPERDWTTWLDRTLTDPAVLTPLLAPIDPAGWEAVAVDRKVGNVRNQGADVLAETGARLVG